MERIGEVISRVMAGEGYRKRSRQGPVYDLWPQVVGEFLAEKSRPVSIRNGVLLVQVEDSVWMHELQLEKYQILQRLWKLVGEEEITDIRWTARGYGLSPPRRRRALPTEPPPRPLTQDEAAWVEALCAQMGDKDLAVTLRRVLVRYLRAPQRGPKGPADSDPSVSPRQP